jgi:hypothetical protein
MTREGLTCIAGSSVRDVRKLLFQHSPGANQGEGPGCCSMCTVPVCTHEVGPRMHAVRRCCLCSHMTREGLTCIAGSSVRDVRKLLPISIHFNTVQARTRAKDRGAAVCVLCPFAHMKWVLACLPGCRSGSRTSSLRGESSPPRAISSDQCARNVHIKEAATISTQSRREPGRRTGVLQYVYCARLHT